MNARQKAKHYKKLYEQTRYNPVRLVTYRSSTVGLKIKMSVPRSIFPPTMKCEAIAEMPEIKRELSCRLVEELKEYIKVDVEPSIERNYIDVVGTVEVIK